MCFLVLTIPMTVYKFQCFIEKSYLRKENIEKFDSSSSLTFRNIYIYSSDQKSETSTKIDFNFNLP